MISSDTRLRRDGLMILEAAIESVRPETAMMRALHLDGCALHIGTETIDLDRFNTIVALGAGKAGAAMAVGLEQLIGDRLDSGLVVVKDGHGLPTQKIKVLEAGHPIPDQRSEEAGRKMTALVERHRGEGALFFFLLSGGASSLLVAPAENVTLADKRKVTGLLLNAGAEINEINAIRKHLSRIKGGGLARLAHPSKIISLIISDVVGDRLDAIGSGPTAPDPTSWSTCDKILKKYRIWNSVPNSVATRISKGTAKKILDTPFPGEPFFAGVSNHIIASNRRALAAAAGRALDLGYTPMLLGGTIQGETRDIARMHAAIAVEIMTTANPIPPPCCVISGGETTVTLGDRHGLGGRNQEFALAAAWDIRKMKRLLILSAGTDGTDGPTDAAGALVTGSTIDRAIKAGLDAETFLRQHNAYHFFNALGDLIKTGPTLTNVMDIHLILAAGK